MNLQNLVKDFNLKNRVDVETAVRLLDLTSEVGEVCKLGFSASVGKAVETSKWEEELGDVLYSLLSLMSEKDIDAEAALKSVLAKYASRAAKTGSMNSGC